MRAQLACVSEFEEWKARLPVALEDRVLAILHRYCDKAGSCDEKIIAGLCPGWEIRGVLVGLERAKIARSTAVIYDQINRKGRIWMLRA